jgi:sec-independent protein translocase protein TatA
MTASILNLAGPDLVIILMIVLLLFGAKRIPKLARGIRESLQEFKRINKTTTKLKENPETKK